MFIPFNDVNPNNYVKTGSETVDCYKADMAALLVLRDVNTWLFLD